MKIFYDGYVFTLQKHGGINRIFTEVSTRMRSVAPDVDLVRYRFPIQSDSVNPMYWVPKLGGLLRRFDGSRLNSAIRVSRPDIYHPTYYRLGNPAGAKTIVTVYDMIPEKFQHNLPGIESVIREKKKCVLAADKVIAISEHTKEDACAYYGLPHEKVVVIPLAASDLFSNTSDPEAKVERFKLPHNFVLHVGHRGGYKNFKILMGAFGLLRTKPGLFLVCVGGGPWTTDEEKAIVEFKLGGRIHHYQDVSDLDLKLIYSKAQLFVYPSLYEGFGIPLLEAMACGAPVLAARSSSLPEVGGDAATYFDPTNLEELADKITGLIENTELRATLIKRGYARAHQFSWDITAKKTYSLYQSVL